MNRARLNMSRLIVGLALVCIAVLLFVFGKEADMTAGAVAFGVLGLISIAISRRG